ncbi:hypothetical protein MMC12_001182 [Toensbergia leucococca]|nr:hypothetical protein [Toensbergia leucococca]
MAGPIICDYYLVRKGYYQIKDFYDARASSPYYYCFGFHWRGYTAYICGILINIVGFVGAIKGAGVNGQDNVPLGAQYIYNVNFFAGFLVSAGVYYALCRISPIPATSDHWKEIGDEITDISLVYHDSNTFDEERMLGSDQMKGQDLKDGGVRERNVASDFEST